MPTPPLSPASSADFVVVGAGSSGAVAARRLLDHCGPDVSVLLLEAGGPDDSPIVASPLMMPLRLGSEDDWRYTTSPQAGGAGRQLGWPRGKVLGGSSSLNGMIWVRGSAADYDHWAYLGNGGWSWSDVLPIYREIESYEGGENEYRGGHGLMRVTDLHEPNLVQQAIVAASVESGIAFNPDYNGPEIDGISYMQYSIDGGKRNSTSRAYLRPVADDPRLTVLVRAHAHRLIMSGTRCVGVEYESGGRIEQAFADREVIVSAGAIGSPQLLMLSGIGPADELRRLGVDVVAHLPGVGQNLQDHLQVPVIVPLDRPIPETPDHQSVSQTHLFWRSRPGLIAPDVQPINYHFPVYVDGLTGPENAITLSAGLIRPHSRGEIRLTGPDVDDPLLLDPAILQARADVDTLTAAVQLCREIGAAPALQEWGAKELHPGPDARTDQDVAKFVRRTAQSYHHQSGTCKMGVDPLAVVDHRLRVHGIDGLRVADASIMPDVTSGNTNAPCVLIGERVARFLAEESGAPVAPASDALGVRG